MGFECRALATKAVFPTPAEGRGLEPRMLPSSPPLIIRTFSRDAGALLIMTLARILTRAHSEIKNP